MRLPRVRLTIRVLMVVVAVAAVPMAFWETWFGPIRAWFDSPVQRWQRAITDDQNGSGRFQALREMGNGDGIIDTEAALTTLHDALRSPSFRVRQTAVVGLGQFGPKARSAVAALIEALTDPEPLIRCAAAAELISVLPPSDPGRDEVVPALRGLLADRSPYVRLQAARTLTEFGHGGDALPVLIEALRRPDYHAQSQALWSIGDIGLPASLDALPEVKALESRAKTLVAPDMARFLRVDTALARRRLGERTSGLATLRSLAESSDTGLANEARRFLSYFPYEAEAP